MTAGDAVIEGLDLRPDIACREDLARDGVGARNGSRRSAGVFLCAHREHRPHAIDEAVGDRGGDDLAAQAVALQPCREAPLHRRGKVADELGGEVGVLRHVRVHERLVEPDLAVGEDDRELGARQALAGLAALGDLLLRRQELERAIEIAGALQGADHRGVLGQALLGVEFAGADRLALQIVVAQHERGDLVGHLHEQPVASRRA